MQRDLGRSPRTVQAYARSLVDYLRFCERRASSADAGRAEIAGYVRDLRERPGRHGANVIAIDSGAGLANATLQLRVTVVRLFYEFLVEERVRDRNPVARGTAPRRARGPARLGRAVSSRCRGSRLMRSGGRSWRSRPASGCGTG